MDIMTAPHIGISENVAGGKPRIAGHRITVQHIVIWHERMGLSADEIASNHGLSLAEIYAALRYYYDHRQEIDEGDRIGRHRHPGSATFPDRRARSPRYPR